MGMKLNDEVIYDINDPEFFTEKNYRLLSQYGDRNQLIQIANDGFIKSFIIKHCLVTPDPIDKKVVKSLMERLSNAVPNFKTNYNKKRNEIAYRLLNESPNAS